MIKDNERIAVQAKRHNSMIGVSAVQEVTAVKGYYKVQKGMVISNSFFTKNAEILAAANEIELWDRDKLAVIMLKNNYNESTEERLQFRTTSKMNTCPKCDGRLVRRTGYKEQFLGCSNYPECHYTRNF